MKLFKRLNIKGKNLTKKAIFTRVLVTMFLALVFSTSIAYTVSPQVEAHAQSCVDSDYDGHDDSSGALCLALDGTSLAAPVFGWANLIIPILLPIAAIGIGMMFGSQIVGGIRNLFAGIKIMG